MKSICLDFDGVLNNYTGWKGPDELFEPRPGVVDFLNALRERGFHLVIHSTRPAAKIRAWLATFGIEEIEVTDSKPPAMIYLDDRGLQFKGDYGETLAAIEAFAVYWESKAA